MFKKHQRVVLNFPDSIRANESEGVLDGLADLAEDWFAEHGAPEWLRNSEHCSELDGMLGTVQRATSFKDGSVVYEVSIDCLNGMEADFEEHQLRAF